jgi:5-methylcytosine-specific restriction endonuclease McrA
MTSLRGHDRQEFPAAVKRAAFRRCCKNGLPYCEGCGNQIRLTPIYEHIVPAGLRGEPTLENCKVHCKTCADVKTFTEDNPRMAKADRVLRKSFGLQPKRHKIKSRGFAQTKPQNTATRPIRKWSPYAQSR